MITARRIALALLGVLALVTSATTAEDALPSPEGWVTDLAGFLPAEQERALESELQHFKDKNGHEIAILIVPGLGGRPIERYALETARSWGLGEKDEHNGALLLIALEERKVRIEVGRGLEGTLTDSVCGRIIRDVIAPEFKEGRFYRGLRAGVGLMNAAAGGDYDRLPAAKQPARSSSLLRLLPMLFFLILFSGMFRHRGRRRGGGLLSGLLLGSLLSTTRGRQSSGWRGGSFGGGSFGGGGGFSGGGASGGW